MDITITNCNNIENGSIHIQEGRLNLKYAINGTGKSTIARAIAATVNDDKREKQALTPFKYVNDAENHPAVVNGIDGIKSVAIFNEDYINRYIFQSNELIANSFDIFIKTPDYEKHILEIKRLLSGINEAFKSHPELDELIATFGSFIDGFGKAKGGYSAAGAIGKGIGKGNKIENIPAGLEVYSPYLKDKNNTQWIKWQLQGASFLEIADQCPYCSGSIEDKKETIVKVGQEYDAKAIEHLLKMLDIFKELLPYFSDSTVDQIRTIMSNSAGLIKPQIDYLVEIKKEVENFLQQLLSLKNLGFFSLQNAEKISDKLKSYKLQLEYYHHLNSKLTQEKVAIINASLDEVISIAGHLQGEIAQQKKTIKTTIETYSQEINDFLYYAGYKYKVIIENSQGEDYKILMKHVDASSSILENAKSNLSYGERNAFALVLFMYSALKDNPDLIILDDPISSFDGNKKFAIINMLFMNVHSFKNRAVLLLSHDFNTVIDIIYNMPYNINPAPKAAFLTTKQGLLTEKEIQKKDILSFVEIAQTNISSDIDTLNKLVYLRRLFELQNKGNAWQLVSNIFKKREVPIYHYSSESTPDRDMTNEEIQDATQEIRKYISGFTYSDEIKKTQNVAEMKKLYSQSRSNYEKLQLYRIMFPENHGNKVIKKFINEVFHLENDYLFQLNPVEYDTVPQYIIDECDKDV